MTLEPMMSAEELAELVGVSVATVYQWNYLGTGPRKCRLGRRIRYRRSDVEAWIEASVENGRPSGAN